MYYRCKKAFTIMDKTRTTPSGLICDVDSTWMRVNRLYDKEDCVELKLRSADFGDVYIIVSQTDDFLANHFYIIS